jgi:hypothetical protein
MEVRVFERVDTLGATAADITSRVGKVQKSGERTTNVACSSRRRIDGKEESDVEEKEDDDNFRGRKNIK